MGNNLNLEVKVTCEYCSREFILKVNKDDYQSWKSGELHAQDAFPYLSPSERELLISQCCGDCWDKMWNYEDPMEASQDTPEDINDYIDDITYEEGLARAEKYGLVNEYEDLISNGMTPREALMEWDMI